MNGRLSVNFCRLSMNQTTSDGKISALEAELEGVKTRLEHSRTQYERRLDDKGKQLSQVADDP